MKKFILYIARTFLIVIVLMICFDALYTYVYTNGMPRSKYQYILQMKPHKIDYVFLGSSRTANHIISSEVTKLTGKSAINLGIEGSVADDDLVVLELLLDRKITIGKVFLQVDYLYNNSGSSPIANAAVLPFIHNPTVAKQLKPQLPNFAADYYIPFYRYWKTDHVIGFREFFLTVTGKASRVDFKDGFLPKYGHQKLTVEHLPDSIAARNKAIEKIQAICKANNIELEIFFAPMCSKTENMEFIDKLKRKLPDLKDYSRALPDSLFCNCKHLNIEGAKAFTKMIVEKGG